MTNVVPFQEMQGMAEAVAKSKLFGMTDPNQVLALMAVAQAEGLHPATAARDYHIIQGRPALKADAMLARFQQAGGKVDWKCYTDEKVTGVFSHPNGGSLEVTWTLDQAQRVGLVKAGSGWAKYPRAMLRARTVSEGIRSVYPGCVVGAYTPEEISDFEPSQSVSQPMKDMGYAEVVRDEEVIEVVNEVKDWHLYLPDGSVYASYMSDIEWLEGLQNMVTKINGSAKMNLEQKEEKIKALAVANNAVKVKLSTLKKAAFNSVVGGDTILPGELDG